MLAFSDLGQQSLYAYHRLVYADILGRWGLFQKRAEILKVFTGEPCNQESISSCDVIGLSPVAIIPSLFVCSQMFVLSYVLGGGMGLGLSLLLDYRCLWLG